MWIEPYRLFSNETMVKIAKDKTVKIIYFFDSHNSELGPVYLFWLTLY